jgi:uncharacterized membrane protein
LIIAVLAGLPSGALSYFLTRLAIEIVEPSFLPFVNVGIRGVGQILNLLVSSYFAGGIVELALKVARGQRTTMGDAFGGGKYFGAMLVGNFCAQIAVSIGLLLCVVPGLILAAGLGLFSYLIVDQKLGGIDALKKSWEMTNGHKSGLVVFILLSILAIIAGAYIYLKIKGEQPRLPGT